MLADSVGVMPQNQASAWFSVVPVLPPAGRPMLAPTPVPSWTFSSRILVTSAATQSAITRRRCGLPQPASVSTLPFASLTSLIAVGLE